MIVDAPRAIDFGRVDLHPAAGAVIVGAAHEGGTAHIGDVVDRLTGRQAVRDLDDCALGIAIEQQIALRIDNDRAADFVLPVVVMRDASQRTLDAADDDRHILVGLATALRVDQRRTVGALAAFIARGIGVVAADLAIGGIPVDHRIHIAGGDAEKQIRAAQRLERLGTLPIGLRNDADAKSLRLKGPADDRHAEARMIDIGVAGHNDDVATVPAELRHLFAAHRQKWGNTEALRPVGTIGGQRFGGRKDGECTHQPSIVPRNRGTHPALL